MAAPTIIIGIGTSGLYTLENVQRFYYETYKANKPANVELLYIETNEDNRPIGTPIGNSITRVYISLDSMAKMIEGIRSTCDDPSWLPDSKLVLAAGMGAGGIRSCGRLAFWGRNEHGDNFINVINAIDRAYANVMGLTNNSGEKKVASPAVFVTGSLTGGTGAGVFIDMGYLVRHLIPEIKDLYGLFLLPKAPSGIRGNEVMYGNSYGALNDLQYYNMIENSYTEKWPNGFPKNYSMPPYELVQFISQDYKGTLPAISTLPGLYKMAGLYLFLNIAGIYEKRKERLVDAAGNSMIGKYGTFGLSAIQFPKGQIQEFVAIRLSVDLLERLTDPEQYYLNGQQRPISRATIKQNASAIWDEILEKAFSALNTVEQKDLLVNIEKDAIRINKGDIKGSVVETIMSMFTSSRNDNYHALVSNNILAAMNEFVDGIYQHVDRGLQSTENLYFARYVLEDIVESIERTLNYWRSLGLSSQAANWDNELRKLAIGCTKNTYKSVLEHDAVLKDRLFAIFDLMKMHLSIKTLLDICKHVKEGVIKISGNNYELPKLKFFDDCIRQINVLIGRNEDQEGHLITFSRRVKDIEADIRDTTLPILRVYPSGSFEKECDIAKQTYTRKSGAAFRSMREVIKEQNILEYFKRKMNGRMIEDTYLEFLNAYRERIDERECIADFPIADYIRNHTEESVSIARRANSPFLKIEKILSSNVYMPRFVVADDKNDVVAIIRDFSSKNYTEFRDSSDGVMELGNVKNIVVFYDERGNFDMPDDLSYVTVMKDAYENVPPGLSDKNINKERWMNNRSAYNTRQKTV